MRPCKQSYRMSSANSGSSRIKSGYDADNERDAGYISDNEQINVKSSHSSTTSNYKIEQTSSSQSSRVKNEEIRRKNTRCYIPVDSSVDHAFSGEKNYNRKSLIRGKPHRRQGKHTKTHPDRNDVTHNVQKNNRSLQTDVHDKSFHVDACDIDGLAVHTNPESVSSGMQDTRLSGQTDSANLIGVSDVSDGHHPVSRGGDKHRDKSHHGRTRKALAAVTRCTMVNTQMKKVLSITKAKKEKHVTRSSRCQHSIHHGVNTSSLTCVSDKTKVTTESETDTDDTHLHADGSSDVDLGSSDVADDKGWDTDLELDEVREAYDHTGKAVYLEGCRRFGVVPASYFLRHMTDSYLDMKHHGLGSAGVKAIAISLVSNPHVMSLNLSDNWLGRSGSRAVSDMLRENCFITHLNLSDNHLSTEFAESLLHTLEMNNSMTNIDLSGNDFNDQAAKFLADIILKSKHLEHLNLSHNKFAEAAGICLGPAISENSCLKTLDISWNCIRRLGALAIAVGIKNNVYMKKINLSWNGFALEGALALADAIKSNAVLEELDITNNRLTTECMVWIGKGLAGNESLQVLKMGSNPIESSGCYAICAALLRAPTCVIRELDFTNIQVNKDFLELLPQVKEQFPKLNIKYGSFESPQKPRSRVHPMYKLQTYMDKNSLRLVDFFNQVDQDKSLSVTRSEFIDAIKETGIQLTDEEIVTLVEELDCDGDGEVNYSELVIGHTNYHDNQRRSHTVPLISVKHS